MPKDVTRRTPAVDYYIERFGEVICEFNDESPKTVLARLAGFPPDALSQAPSFEETIAFLKRFLGGELGKEDRKIVLSMILFLFTQRGRNGNADRDRFAAYCKRLGHAAAFFETDVQQAWAHLETFADTFAKTHGGGQIDPSAVDPEQSRRSIRIALDRLRNPENVIPELSLSPNPQATK